MNEHIIKSKPIQVKERILNEFIVLLEYNKRIKNIYKVNAYTKAINNLKKIDNNIFHDKNLLILKIKNENLMGKKLLQKIIDFYIFDGVPEVKKIIINNKDYTDLLKVKGVGPSTLLKLNNVGIYTLHDLYTKSDFYNGNNSKYKLNNLQRLGLLYYYDLNTLIPRNEIIYLCNILHTILGDFDITGSFRRGYDFSGDIDILLKNTNDFDIQKKKITLSSLFLVTLAQGSSKFSFLIKSPYSNLVRQVDIKLVPEKSYYTALLHFTGSNTFNIYMRNIAKKLGMKLNEYGLFKNSKSIPIHSEKDIFNILNINYIPAEKRK